ncbi:hypothetical protein I7I50_01431 [Histoplasma capsulatum G186AR]|uniref:Uncharacterized protein n=1 Tax=Ajellomyces capsulatus TaxID=5037 RepID=A0A8H8CT34_AJECA|nr:hypothetical protein I7I52_12547 [Histoplasma capsulatum]QSS73310.1 hypothetical protein I7I50_01431 [Histoplasma capsulatum G186AR]
MLLLLSQSPSKAGNLRRGSYPRFIQQQTCCDSKTPRNKTHSPIDHVYIYIYIYINLQIRDKVLRRRIGIALQPLFHGRQIHRRYNDIVVVGDLVSVDRVEEGPGLFVVLDLVQETPELVEVAPVAGLPR